jgi:hypothetical protein
VWESGACAHLRVDDLCQLFATRFGPEITRACRVTPDTEWQLDTFGVGSAWCCESPFTIHLLFLPGRIGLEVWEDTPV